MVLSPKVSSTVQFSLACDLQCSEEDPSRAIPFWPHVGVPQVQGCQSTGTPTAPSVAHHWVVCSHRMSCCAQPFVRGYPLKRRTLCLATWGGGGFRRGNFRGEIFVFQSGAEIFPTKCFAQPGPDLCLGWGKYHSSAKFSCAKFPATVHKAPKIGGADIFPTEIFPGQTPPPSYTSTKDSPTGSSRNRVRTMAVQCTHSAPRHDQQRALTLTWSGLDWVWSIVVSMAPWLSLEI